MLTATFYSTIAAGARALLTEENRLRKLGCNGDPRILLSLRDVSGLRARLDMKPGRAWEDVPGALLFSPQDIGVIEELESRYAGSPYRDGAVLRELREALNWYLEQDSSSWPAER